MRLPGLAWLERIVDSDESGRRLFRQRALFHPLGLAGHAYWAMNYPFHGIVFGGMQRNIAMRRSTQEFSPTPEAGPKPELRPTAPASQRNQS